MTTCLVRVAVIAGCVAMTTTSVLAQPSSQSCRTEVTSTGASALTLKGAQDNAIRSWQRSVVLRYGELYSIWDQSSDKSVDRCGRTTFGLNRCDARAKPCQSSAPGRTREISCLKNDSKECSPAVKWIQTRLNSKTGSRLETDGGEGRMTEAAIRKFKQSNNLGNNAEIDDALMAALE